MAEHDNPPPEGNQDPPAFSSEEQEWIEQLVANQIAATSSVGPSIPTASTNAPILMTTGTSTTSAATTGKVLSNYVSSKKV